MRYNSFFNLLYKPCNEDSFINKSGDVDRRYSYALSYCTSYPSQDMVCRHVVTSKNTMSYASYPIPMYHVLNIKMVLEVGYKNHKS